MAKIFWKVGVAIKYSGRTKYESILFRVWEKKLVSSSTSVISSIDYNFGNTFKISLISFLSIRAPSYRNGQDNLVILRTVFSITLVN